VSPERGVTIMGCRAVSTTRPPTHWPPRPHARQRYRPRQTTPTDASEQNNTGPLGGPVIMAKVFRCPCRHQTTSVKVLEETRSTDPSSGLSSSFPRPHLDPWRKGQWSIYDNSDASALVLSNRYALVLSIGYYVSEYSVTTENETNSIGAYLNVNYFLKVNRLTQVHMDN